MVASIIYRHQWSITLFRTLLRLLRSMIGILRGKQPLEESCIHRMKNRCGQRLLEQRWSESAGYEILRRGCHSAPACASFTITSGDKASATATAAGCSAGC